MAHDEHKGEMKNLLFAIRKCLICVPNLCDNVRAMLVMTIDLSSRNFSQNMDPDLQIFYEPYLCNVQKIVNQNGHLDPCDGADGQKSDGESTDPYQSLKTKLSNGDDLISKQQKHQLRINAEYIGKPLNAAARLKLAQTQMKNKSCAEEEKLLKQFVTTVADKKQSDAKSSDNIPTVPVDLADSRQSTDDDDQHNGAVPESSILRLDTSFKCFANQRDGENVDGQHHTNHTVRSSNNGAWPQPAGNIKREGNYRQRGSNRQRQQGRERKNSTSSQHDHTQSLIAVDDATPIVRKSQRGGRGGQNRNDGGAASGNTQQLAKNQDEKRFHIKSGTGVTDQKLFLQKRINGYLNKTNSIPKKKSLSVSVENITSTEENWD